MKADLFAGIGGMFISMAVWVVSASFPSFAVSKAGPAYYPRLVALLFGVTCLGLVLKALKEKAADKHWSGREAERFVVVLAILILYYFAMDWLGYFSATFLAGLALALYVFRTLSLRTIFLSIFNALVICGGIYLLFQIMLKAPLPRGILF